MAMLKTSDFLTGEVLDLSEVIALTSPTDTPLTTLLMSKGKTVPATDITVTWRERALNADRGTLKLEGADAGTPIKSSRSLFSNLCQIIEKVTQVSGTAEALNPKGIGKSFEAEVNDRLIEVKRDLEWYFLNGTKASESGSTPRQMNGLVNLIASANVLGNDTTTTLTEALILDGFQKMWEKGAQGEYYAFCNATIKRTVNALLSAGSNVRVNITNGIDQTLGIAVQRVESDFGIINLVVDRQMADYTFFAVDLDMVEIAELRPTFFEMLPKAGDYLKGHILNESSIKLLNSYAAFKIINVGKPVL